MHVGVGTWIGAEVGNVVIADIVIGSVAAGMTVVRRVSTGVDADKGNTVGERCLHPDNSAMMIMAAIE